MAKFLQICSLGFENQLTAAFTLVLELIGEAAQTLVTFLSQEHPEASPGLKVFVYISRLR